MSIFSILLQDAEVTLNNIFLDNCYFYNSNFLTSFDNNQNDLINKKIKISKFSIQNSYFFDSSLINVNNIAFFEIN